MRSFLFAVNCANKTLPAISTDHPLPPNSHATFFIVDGFFFFYIYTPLFRSSFALYALSAIIILHTPARRRFYYQRFYFIAFTSYKIKKNPLPQKRQHEMK